MTKQIDQATIDHWHETCERMNRDDPDNYVPLWDVEYWAEQIHNLTDEQDYNHALAIAQAVSEVRIVNEGLDPFVDSEPRSSATGSGLDDLAKLG